MEVGDGTELQYREASRNRSRRSEVRGVVTRKATANEVGPFSQRGGVMEEEEGV